MVMTNYRPISYRSFSSEAFDASSSLVEVWTSRLSVFSKSSSRVRTLFVSPTNSVSALSRITNTNMWTVYAGPRPGLLCDGSHGTRRFCVQTSAGHSVTHEPEYQCNEKVPTRGRTDHFRTNSSTNNQLEPQDTAQLRIASPRHTEVGTVSLPPAFFRTVQ